MWAALSMFSCFNTSHSCLSCLLLFKLECLLLGCCLCDSLFLPLWVYVFLSFSILSFSFSSLITIILCHCSSLRVFFFICLSVFVISCNWLFFFFLFFIPLSQRTALCRGKEFGLWNQISQVSVLSLTLKSYNGEVMYTSWVLVFSSIKWG